MIKNYHIPRYFDNEDLTPVKEEVRIKKTGEVRFTIYPNGGIIFLKN